MRRLALLALVLIAPAAAPAHAATNEYSTGNVKVRIGDRLDQAIDVPDSGPISFVRVSFRIGTPQTSALSISLISPKGTEEPLVVRRSSGADFGSDEKGCGGIVTVLDSDTTGNPISA